MLLGYQNICTSFPHKASTIEKRCPQKTVKKTWQRRCRKMKQRERWRKVDLENFLGKKNCPKIFYVEVTVEKKRSSKSEERY